MQGLKTIVLGILLLLGFAHADEKKVVFDLTTGDATRIENRIVNVIKTLSNTYDKQQDELKAVVVISGKAYKYFIDDLKHSPYKDDKQLIEVQKKLQPMFEELSQKYNVRFDMCGAGMQARKISPDTLYSFVHFDKMKYVYLIDWQNRGYAYVPI